MNSPINKKTGHPLAPSRQLLATWVVAAWEKVPEDLVKKACLVCAYTDIKDIDKKATSKALVQYSSHDLGSLVESIAGSGAMMAWIDDANDPVEFSEEEDEDNNLNDVKYDESVEEVQVEDNEGRGDGENIYDKYFGSSI